jgi:copper resistance protein B
VLLGFLPGPEWFRLRRCFVARTFVSDFGLRETTMNKKSSAALRAVLLAAASILAIPVQAEADESSLQGGLTVDRLEMQQSIVDHTDFGYWHADGWIGGEKNKLLLKTEGNYSKGQVSNSLTQVLYGRSVSESWDLEVGAAQTGAPGPTRNWLAVTAEGDLPLSIDSEWMLFLARNNQAWLRTQFETAVPLGNSWKVVPKLELNFYSKNDPVHETDSGLSNAELSLRLAYDFTKNVAGYVGYSRYQTFGSTAGQLSAGGNSTFDNLLITGLMISLILPGD